MNVDLRSIEEKLDLGMQVLRSLDDHQYLNGKLFTETQLTTLKRKVAHLQNALDDVQRILNNPKEADNVQEIDDETMKIVILAAFMRMSMKNAFIPYSF